MAQTTSNNIQFGTNDNYNPQMHHNAELYDNCAQNAIIILNQALGAYSQKLGVTNEDLKIKGRVIDIACGQGSATNFLSKYLDKEAKIDATDISEEVLRYARKHYPESGANFMKMDARAPVPEDMKEKYDFVVSNAFVHWENDHRNLFKNFAQLLKPGKDCLICFFAYMPIFEAYKDVSKIPKWSKYMKNVEDIIPISQYNDKYDEVMKSIMKECGFENICVKMEAVDYGNIKPVQDLNDYKDLFTAVDPFIMGIPKHEHEEYMEAIIHSFIDHGGLQDFDKQTYRGGPIKYDSIILIAIGTKK